MKHWLTRLNPLGCCLLILFAAGAALAQAGKSSTAKPPNYLFIAIDDLNDWVGPLGGHPQVKTPHIDRLAARRTLFTNAHTLNIHNCRDQEGIRKNVVIEKVSKMMAESEGFDIPNLPQTVEMLVFC